MERLFQDDNDSAAIIHLNDEAGNDIAFELLDIIKHDNHEYIVVLPVEDDADQVAILEIVDSGNPSLEEYVGVEDTAVLNAVYSIFKKRFENEFEFID